MHNRKWIRLTAVLLIFGILSGVLLSAGASNLVGDVNGDGKITAFDAQMIAESNAGRRQLSETQSAVSKGVSIQNILDYILGDTDVDAGDTDGDGIQEIYTAKGLQRLHTVPNGKFILMNDLDLNGAEWTPIAGFSGNLDGNGKTISNFSIHTCVADSKHPEICNQGFFGDTTTDAVISNLHLENVTLNAAADAQYIGFFAGTLRGNLTGCTVTGTLNDTREVYPVDMYTGVMVGLLANGSNGSIEGGTSLSITDTAQKHTTEGLCANVKLNIVNDAANAKKVGLAGWAPSSYTVTGLWTDTTYSSSLLSETIQVRQEKVVNYMTAMASVEWTPAEDWTYTTNNNTNQTYKSGTTYTGLPYNRHNGSLERFLSVMQAEKVTNKDGKTVYISQPGLGSNCGYDAATGTWSDTGFYLYMGNHCSGAVGWAWDQVSNTVAKDDLSHNTPYKGGAYVLSTDHMIPTDDCRTEYGIYPVGDWETSYVNENKKWVSAEYDATKAAYQCEGETYAADVLLREDNGMDTIWEAYAQTHKADAIVTFVANWGGNEGGHARLVVADPVVIRNANGTIDGNASYMLTTEQGVNFTTTSTSHWKIEEKYTFYTLTGKVPESAVTNLTKVYLPITIRALKEDKIRENYLVSDPKNPIIGPVAGTVYSYHHINSVTVKVTNETGKVYYNREAFTGIGSNAAGRNNSQDLAKLHGETFAAAAIENGMISGNTYYYTVDVLLSTGDTMRLVTNKAFTYTA